MDLKPNNPNHAIWIQGYDEHGFTLSTGSVLCPVVIVGTTQSCDCIPSSWQALQADHIQQWLDFKPDVILIGTGRTPKQLPHHLLALFWQAGLQPETMTTSAACRTYNVLVSEDRHVLAALYPMD